MMCFNGYIKVNRYPRSSFSWLWSRTEYLDRMS